VTSAASLQNRFHDLVTAFVNEGSLTRGDRMRALFSSGAPFRRNAPAVCDAYGRFREHATDASLPDRVIEVDHYSGANRFVLAMAASLSAETQSGLAGAYVHGSLATGEEIPYSDFDALVILRDELFADHRRLAAVARELSDARKYMFLADPLQHHGWFVLTEADLRYYCDAYFPEVLFHYSRSLLPGGGRSLTIRKRPCLPEMRTAFEALAGACLKSLGRGQFLRNAYLTKCLLSQFMLLPAMYVQARYAESIYKKFSFDRARRDFTPAEWDCMDQISRLRLEWKVPVGRWAGKLLSVTGPLRNTIVRNVSPAVPPGIRSQITPELIRDMATLIRRMQSSLPTDAAE
jgi:predicted nucleotidyltransferase